MHVLHLITALNVGGAETMLAKLLEQERASEIGITSSVLSLMPPGPAGGRIQRAGVPIATAGLRGLGSLPGAVQRLSSTVRSLRPDIIVAWMYHAHLAAALAQVVRPRTPVIWNVRHSVQDIREEKRSSQAILKGCARLSRMPAAIIYNSHVAADQYRALGYSSERAVVIPNGFECDVFRPDPSARGRILNAFGLADGKFLVGMVARAHPMKDPANLVRAVRHASVSCEDMHLLIIGAGMDRPNPELRQLIDTLPPGSVTLSGHRPDIADLLPGLDVLAMPSAWGEGFPNIVGEAMSSGVPCAVTDVGDSRWIVGDTGITVPPRDPLALGEGLRRLAALPSDERRQLGQAARARILNCFSLPEVTAQYHLLFEAVREGRRSHGGSNKHMPARPVSTT